MEQTVARESFQFCKGTKTGKPVFVAPKQVSEWITLEDGTEGGVIPPKVVKVLRKALNLGMIGTDCPENVDVSGFGVNSPSQLIRRGDKFICVPYNEKYLKKRTKPTGECYFGVKDVMENHEVNVKTGKKPVLGDKVQKEPAPIERYNETVFKLIKSRINQMSGKASKSPLTIDFTGVEGYTQDDIDEIDTWADMVANPVKIIFEGVDESIFD